MKFKNSLWINRSTDFTKKYFLDYSNIQFFTPSWLKFTLLSESETTVTFQVKIGFYNCTWDSWITKMPNGFKDVLQTGLFHKFVHTHTFKESYKGCYIEDELNIQVTHFQILNKILAPFLYFFLKQAFNQRNETCYKLLYDFKAETPYISSYDRLLLLKRKFELTNDLYLIPIFLGTQKLHRFQRLAKRIAFLLPKMIQRHIEHFDQINNRVIHDIKAKDFGDLEPMKKFEAYLNWEQERIIAPNFWKTKSQYPRLYWPLFNIFYYSEKKLKFRYLTLSFSKTSARKKFSLKLMAKVLEDYNPKRLLELSF